MHKKFCLKNDYNRSQVELTRNINADSKIFPSFIEKFIATSGIPHFYEIFSDGSDFFYGHLVIKTLEQLNFYTSPNTPSHFLLRL